MAALPVARPPLFLTTQPDALPPSVTCSFAPQQGYCFADAHVVVVEVAKTGESEGGDQKKCAVGDLDVGLSVDVVRQHLANAPVSMQSEGGSQREIYCGSGVEVSHGAHSQQQDAYYPFACPVQRGSFGPRASIESRRGVESSCEERMLGLIVLLVCH